MRHTNFLARRLIGISRLQPQRISHRELHIEALEGRRLLAGNHEPPSVSLVDPIGGSTIAAQVLNPRKTITLALDGSLDLEPLKGQLKVSLTGGAAVDVMLPEPGDIKVDSVIVLPFTGSFGLGEIEVFVQPGARATRVSAGSFTVAAADNVIDASPNEASIIGDWRTLSDEPDQIGGTYIHDRDRGQGKSVTFRPILHPGTYEVAIKWVAGDNRATKVPYEILHRDGLETGALDQSVKHVSGWQSVGDFFFDPDVGRVTIRNSMPDGTDLKGLVVLDAVRFRFVSTDEPTEPVGKRDLVTARLADPPNGSTISPLLINERGSIDVTFSGPTVDADFAKSVELCIWGDAVGVSQENNGITARLDERDLTMRDNNTFSYVVPRTFRVGEVNVKIRKSELSNDTCGMETEPANQTDGMETEPTDPTDGMETEPTDPTDGMETEPTDQTDGMETEPTDPTDGMETEPTDPTDGMETEPTDPTDGMETEPTDPTDGLETEPADQADGSTPEVKTTEASFNVAWVTEVDNTDAEKVFIVGGWTSGTNTRALRGEFIHDRDSDDNKSVSYFPQLADGVYQVDLRWISGDNRARSVPVEITSFDFETSATVISKKSVNQRRNDGNWVPLGIFSFKPNVGQVTIRADGADGFVVADGVRFSFLDLPPTPPSDSAEIPPEPKGVPLDQVTIVFNQPVEGFDIKDLGLETDETTSVQLTDAMLTQVDERTWTLINLADITADAGIYELTINATGTDIRSADGLAIIADDLKSGNIAKVGDVNFDGLFDQRDIVALLQGGNYLTGRQAEWEEGDWNGDGLFDQLDLALALQLDNYSP